MEIVIRVELPLAVEVDVDVQALADDAGRANGILRVRADRRESGAAPGDRELPFLRRAPKIAELIGFQLEAQVELHCQIGVLAEDPAVLSGSHTHEGRLAWSIHGGRGDDGSNILRSKERRAASQQARGPGLRQYRGWHARAEPAARRECRIVRRNERRHAERVHRSLRIYLGYDERGGE